MLQRHSAVNVPLAGAGGDSTYPGSADAAEKKVKWSQDVGRPGTAPSTVRSQVSSDDTALSFALSYNGYGPSQYSLPSDDHFYFEHAVIL